MDLADSPEEAAFRERVRAWLSHALPGLPWPEPADLAAKLPFWRQWQQLLFEAGFAGMSWPREYGGQGADAKISPAVGYVTGQMLPVDGGRSSDAAHLLPMVARGPGRCGQHDRGQRPPGGRRAG